MDRLLAWWNVVNPYSSNAAAPRAAPSDNFGEFVAGTKKVRILVVGDAG
jgi:hypothetical protein